MGMNRGLVNERGRTAASAESDIMEAWGKQLIAGGPLIAIPGIETEELRVKTENGGERTEMQRKAFTLVINPKSLDIKADFKTEVRKRGIFSVPLFSGTLNLSGTFASPEMAISSLSSTQTLALGQAELIISLSDQKGIRKINKSLWNDGELFFQPGNQGNSLFTVKHSEWGEPSRASTGIYAALPRIENNEASFNVSIEVRGGQSIKVLPMGQDTHVSISSDWASPSFQGAFLPGESTVTGKDFTASWDISYLSRDIPLFYTYSGSSRVYTDSLFGVNFFRTIDTYALNTRAVKYAILFLIVPFLTLFLLEVFTKRRIHPVPYLLSGIGNEVFYLLLLSLSEQMPFYIAYLIAALAVTALLTLYSRSQPQDDLRHRRCPGDDAGRGRY
ncbi:hypothetical protein AGMMS49545_23960 [Betaproteobacteria bacterium]|nr:hypothetical protein AGMMS49545_23960 [Betaproteobacteria bacterium]